MHRCKQYNIIWWQWIGFVVVWCLTWIYAITPTCTNEYKLVLDNNNVNLNCLRHFQIHTGLTTQRILFFIAPESTQNNNTQSIVIHHSNFISLYNFYLGTKIYKMYKMCSISQNQTSKQWEDQSNKISHPKISLVFVWQTLGGQRNGAYGVSAGDFKDYAGWLHHLIAGSVSKLSANPYYIFSREKPHWHGQTPT